MYSPPAFRGPIELDLSRNEGRAPSGLAQASVDPQELARYPDLSALQSLLADRWGVSSRRVLVTAGGDDALLRCCLAVAGTRGAVTIARPTFEMIPRYAQLAGLSVRAVDWHEGVFPTERFIDAAEGAAVVFIVSPNNPTGAVATLEDVARVAAALPNALVVLDAAYGEFADDDPSRDALSHQNVVVVRTLSKAWGLAGLRVGYAIGSEPWIERLAAAGNPYPASSASAAIAVNRLRTGAADVKDYVARTRLEARALTRVLESHQVRVAKPQQANFVLARNLDPAWIADACGSLGVAVRAFPDRPELADAVRITLPGDAESFGRLEHTLLTVLAPEALLFDLDGVLADVSQSYRQAIIQTARSFGVAVSTADISAAKDRGDANDDWELTRRLMEEHGISVSIDQVVERFEAIYQGTEGKPGLRETERLCVDVTRLSAWRRRRPLAVVTGRPRSDAQRFLDRFGIRSLFDAVICREDAALKPDPAPVRLALDRLEVERAWMLGDTRDDLDAARAAGVLPIGVVAPGADCELERSVLDRAGAARVLDRTDDLEGLLP